MQRQRSYWEVFRGEFHCAYLIQNQTCVAAFEPILCQEPVITFVVTKAVAAKMRHDVLLPQTRQKRIVNVRSRVFSQNWIQNAMSAAPMFLYY